MTDTLTLLIEDWRSLAVLLRQDADAEYGAERMKLCERAEVYAECAAQLERRITPCPPSTTSAPPQL